MCRPLYLNNLILSLLKQSGNILLQLVYLIDNAINFNLFNISKFPPPKMKYHLRSHVFFDHKFSSTSLFPLANFKLNLITHLHTSSRTQYKETVR